MELEYENILREVPMPEWTEDQRKAGHAVYEATGMRIYRIDGRQVPEEEWNAAYARIQAAAERKAG